MKKFAIAIAALAMMILGSSDVFAQGKYGADSANCTKYLSYYREYVKSKNYADAIPNWRKAYAICPPTANQNMLVDGTTLLRRLISENAKNPVYKNALVDSLLTLHDQRAQYYPKYAVTALNNKGLDLANYVKDDDQKLFDGYESIININGSQTKTSLLVLDLNAAICLYKASSLSEEEVIEVYERNAQLLSQVTTKTDLEAEQLEKAITDLETLFGDSKVASCDKLIEIYGPRYNADPTNGELASKIVKLMGGADDCLDNNLFMSAATTMYNTNPSGASAYFLYRLNAQTGNVKDAVKYLEEAIASEDTDEQKDAEYYYELATFCYKTGNLKKAIECANTAAKMDKENTVAGKSYFLIATIWGATKCDGNEIQKRSPFWVAVDFLEKAKAKDPSLTNDANAKINEYRKYFPQTAEAFMYDITDGQSFVVSCGGLSATTVVRTQK